MKKFKKSLRTVFLSAAVAISGLGSLGTSAYAQTQITYEERKTADVHSLWEWRKGPNSSFGFPYAAYLVANDNGTLPANITYSMRVMTPSSEPDFRAYELEMQDDGNLVLYKYTYSYKSRWPIWSTGTMGSGANRFVVQKDGNMVLYRPDGVAVWASNTQYWNNGSFYTILQLQNDGNLVMYNYYYTNQGWNRVAVWATGTNE